MAEESEARKSGLNERVIEIKNKEDIRRELREYVHCSGTLIEFLQDISLSECGDITGAGMSHGLKSNHYIHLLLQLFVREGKTDSRQTLDRYDNRMSGCKQFMYHLKDELNHMNVLKVF